MFLHPRVLETSTTTGTGNLTLGGAVAGFQDFITAVVDLNERFPYVIEDQTPGDWERGIGYLSGSTTLVRETVIESSNAGSLVSFAAGTKNVFLTYPEEEFTTKGIQLAISLGWAMP